MLWRAIFVICVKQPNEKEISQGRGRWQCRSRSFDEGPLAAGSGAGLDLIRGPKRDGIAAHSGGNSSLYQGGKVGKDSASHRGGDLLSVGPLLGYLSISKFAIELANRPLNDFCFNFVNHISPELDISPPERTTETNRSPCFESGLS